MKPIAVVAIACLLLAVACSFQVDAASDLVRHRLRMRNGGDFASSVFTGMAYEGQGADKRVFSATVDKTKATKFGLAEELLTELNGKKVALVCEKEVNSKGMKDEKAGFKLLKDQGIDTSAYLARSFAPFQASCLNTDMAVFEPTKKCNWLIMELLQGKDLKEATKDDSMDTIRGNLAKFRALVKEALESVAVLHDKRIIHGDVNERNLRIITTDPAKVKLFDFAGSKLATKEQFESDTNEDTHSFGRYILGFIVKKDQIKPWQDVATQVAGTLLAQDGADKCAFRFLQACFVKGSSARTLLTHKFFDGQDHSNGCL